MTASQSARRPRSTGSRERLLPRREAGYGLAVIGILLIWNLAANLIVPEAASVPFTLLAAALLVVVARRAGVSADALGSGVNTAARGVRVGAPATAVVVVAIATLTAVPASREFFADGRFIGVTIPEMLYEALFRIPIGTALAEEIAFRAVLLGMLLRRISPGRAIAASSVLFGLWHILPGIEALESSPAADLAAGWAATVAEVAGQVIITGIAGAGLAWLRLRSTSIAAPVLAHWAINGIAYIAGWLVVRNTWA